MASFALLQIYLHILFVFICGVIHPGHVSHTSDRSLFKIEEPNNAQSIASYWCITIGMNMNCFSNEKCLKSQNSITSKAG